MKRLNPNLSIDRAPSLVIPWNRGKARLVAPGDVAAVASGIITLSAEQLLYVDVRCWWEFLKRP